MIDTENTNDNGSAVISVWTMEVATAIATMAFASVVIVSNYRLGAGWTSTGPEPGYFPFYVGILMFISGAGVLVGQLISRSVRSGAPFVEFRPLRRVIQILVPTVVYVVLIAYVGIYVASALFIGLFMLWLGRYPLYVAVPVAIGIPLALFLTFEVWFLVPLPKGPLETWLGY